MPMIQVKVSQGDLLYHAVHGLCRVDDLLKENQAGKETLSYSLVPKVANRMKERFIITSTDLQESGFHVLISLKEANEILACLQSGKMENKRLAESASCSENQVWDLAKDIWSFSRETLEIKDHKKRQTLERSAKGLIRELAYVLQITLKETAAKVRKCLGDTPKINPTVLVALVRASGD